MDELFVVGGRVRPSSRGASVAGYSVTVNLQRVLGDPDRGELITPVSGSDRVDGDGQFTVEVGGTGRPTGPVAIEVAAPQGTVVLERELTIEQASKALRLPVRPIERFDVEPSDEPNLGARVRLDGRVIDHLGRPIPSGLPVVVWGRPAGDSEAPERALLVASTQTGGVFTADWIADRLGEATGSVAGGDRVPIPLDGDQLPTSVLLVIDVADVSDEHCGCLEAPPTAPDPADLTANPDAYAQDLGGGCVQIAAPNRVVEEFAYFTTVRTSEPKVKGLTLGVRRTVPTDLYADLLGVSLATQALNPATFQTTRATRAQLPTDGLRLDVESARSLVRSDRPPTVNQIGRATWLSEVSFAKSLVDAGLRNDTGRGPLDIDNPIDWDDTPTIHLAIEVAHGHLLQYREVWRAAGYSRGDLLYSLPLAPGQRRRIAVLDWDRKARSRRDEALEFEEELDAVLSRDRDVTEIVGADLHEQTAAGSSNTTWGVAGGIGAGFIGSGFGIFGGVAGGGGGSDTNAWQRSARQFSADSMQSLRDRVSQRSSAVRSSRSATVQSVSQGETLRAETEVIANYSRCHAVTMEYFQLLRHFLITHELADVQECLFVPLPITEFSRAKALRWREPLSRYLKNRSLRRGFAAIERVADDWEGWDYPEATYAEEAPESLEGELRISFVLPRPRDDADGQFQVDAWAWLSRLLGTNVFELWTARLNERTARERDRIFQAEVAPEIAANLVDQLRFAYVTIDGGEVEVPLDASLVSRYRQGTPLYVSLNPRGLPPALPREDIAHVKIWYDGDELPPDAKVVVHRGKLRYHAPHSTGVLFDDRRVLDDIQAGDPVVISTPLSRRELRNPREEDLELADRLVEHLNASLEYYHQAIWVSLDAQRRYMLLDAVLLPGSNKSLASVCSNELIGIVGNSLVMPVAPGQRLDPTLARPASGDEDEPVDLINAYATAPTPPLRVSVPTRGVHAEAVSGSCNSCEEIDDTRYWRFTADGMLAPPEIGEVSTDTRAADEPDLTPTPLPAPLVEIQNAPAVPDPVGLGPGIELVARPELFRDITGLEGTQRNARAAFEGALAAASSLGEQAHSLASQQELGRNAGRMIDRIEQARADGLLTDEVASRLTNSALEGLIGAPDTTDRPSAGDKAVQDAVDAAAQNSSSDIKVSTPSETVEVSINDTEPSLGASPTPEILDLDGFVDQDVLIKTVVGGVPGARRITNQRLSSFADLERQLGTTLANRFVGAGLVHRKPARPGGYELRWRLRIGYPADPKNSAAVDGAGRLPLVVIAHGHKGGSWSITPAGTRVELPNHEGFTKLQRELARNGILSVSVDMNAANTADSLVEMRAEMALAAIDELRRLDGDATSRFHDRIDFDRVGLVGHSRGGDGVIRARELNQARTTAKATIKAIALLTPTDFTGTTTSPLRLTGDDVFLWVLGGGLDADASGRGGARAFTGSGFRHYDRATCPKSMLFVDQVTHSRQNETWPDERGLLPTDAQTVLSATDQHKLRDQYVVGLMRWQLLGQTSQRGLFDGTTSNGLGAAASTQWSFGSQRKPLDDLDRGSGPAAGSRRLRRSDIKDLADVTVGGRRLEADTEHEVELLAINPGFPSPPPIAYRLNVGSAHQNWTGFDHLTFRIAVDADLTSQATIDGGPTPEYTITISDGTNSADVTAATIGSLHRAVHQTINLVNPKTGAIAGTENTSTIALETVGIPLSSLTGVTLSDVRSVAIVPAAGFTRHLFIDSLQLIRA